MRKQYLGLAMMLSLGVMATVLAAETVRVAVTNGVPQIRVDGIPVRARMFWGAPGSSPLRIGPAGRVISFEFSPTQDEPRHATMHFRFGQSPGEMWLDNIHVQDIDSQLDVVPKCDFTSGRTTLNRDWTVWPTGAKNTVGKVDVAARTGQVGSAALHIELKNPTAGTWPDFHIYHAPNLALKKGHRYRVSFWARAKPARNLTVAFYRPGRVYTYLGGPPGCFASQIKLAAKADVPFVSFPVHMPWPRPGQPVAWTTADRQCQAVLDANPHALLVPRIGMGPPGWWRAAHPDDMMVWDREPVKHADAVVASPTYRHDAAMHLAALVRHLEEKFGGHMAGYHPCGQNTGEWFYQDTWGPALNGYSRASLDAWRRWLGDRYKTDTALRAAWHDPRTRLSDVAIPAPPARRSAPNGLLRDPAREQALIDFAEFQQQMMADCVRALAHAVRSASRGKKLVVFFYGYVFEFGAIHNGPATSGHYALRRVLQCPDIDILCSPISYWDRGLGQSAPAMTAAESVALAGKMWLYEDDTRTYRATGRFPGWQSGADTIQQTNNLLLRNTSQCALRNFGTWWMDLGASGWFDDARMWEQMRRLETLDRALLEHPRAFRPEVAAVIDSASMLRVAYGGDAVTRPGVYEVRRALGRMGTPYGQYLLEDVIAGRVKAKVYVLLNAWCLSASQRRALRDATRGSLCVWCYAPGYLEPDRVRKIANDALTGFQLRPVTPRHSAARPTPSAIQLEMTEPLGQKKRIEPLLAAADARPNETLATYADGSVAVALRKTPDGQSMFVGPPGLTSQLLRIACRRAGVHLFTAVDCNVYRNGPYLVLHAAQDGRLGVDTGSARPLHDILTGKSLGHGPKITLPVHKGDTRVLMIE